jgi:hypothetical protein
MPAEEVVATLRRTWEILGELHVPSALMGGLALAHWGHVRSTQDVDLLIALGGARPERLLARLSAAGYRSKRVNPLVRLDDAAFVQLFYEPPAAVLEIQIDLLLAESDFHRQAVDRRVVVPSSELGFQFDVVSCEDLILLKLLAGRILDRHDASELLKANRDTLDMGHLRHWVHRLHLEREFVDAWSNVFPGTVPPISDPKR